MQRCECWSDDRRSNRCRSARSSQGEALIRTILDTSVLISSLIKGWWPQFADAAEDGRLTLIILPAAIDEFIEVVHRPAFHDLISPSDPDELGNLLRRAELFNPLHI